MWSKIKKFLAWHSSAVTCLYFYILLKENGCKDILLKDDNFKKLPNTAFGPDHAQRKCTGFPILSEAYEVYCPIINTTYVHLLMRHYPQVQHMTILIVAVTPPAPEEKEKDVSDNRVKIWSL